MPACPRSWQPGTLFKTELRSFVPCLGHLTQYHALLTARMDCFLCTYQWPSQGGDPGDIRGHGAGFVNFGRQF